MFILYDLAMEVEVKLFDCKLKVSPQPGTWMDSCLSLCILSVRTIEKKAISFFLSPLKVMTLFSPLHAVKTLKKIAEL